MLAINAVMFAVEIGAGLAAGSAALQADALDFLGDAANYAISLFVVGMALRYRAMAALAKGGHDGLIRSMGDRNGLWHATHGTLPSALTMGAVGFAALAANVASFGLLWVIVAAMRTCARHGFARAITYARQLRSFAGGGSGYSAPDGWPDIIVAAIMAGLALQGAGIVVRQSLGELRQHLQFPRDGEIEKELNTCGRGESK